VEKYIGNKRVLLDTIYQFTQEVCPNTESICDIFAGTTNVARYFRNKGYSTIVNDINRFSYILGSAYLTLKEYPTFEKIDIPIRSTSSIDKLKKSFFSSIKKDKGQLFKSQDAEEIWRQLFPLIQVIDYLNNLNTTHHSNNIVDFFTREGRFTDYKSVRGTHVKRNYFSSENAHKINIIIDQLREWWKNEKISFSELSILLTAIIEEIVLVANVNGTFHDFNRNKLWPNALQEFYLKVPLVSVSDQDHKMYNQDALMLAEALPYTDILYLDPPYNFRQYTSYYHFLNFIAAYPFLENVDAYMEKLTHVRGQNMDDEFKSTFCKKDSFVSSLREVIENTNSRYVIMSYYGGRNHWNHWSSTEETHDEGFNVLKKL
jgi:adenine-specific DNA methylase